MVVGWEGCVGAVPFKYLMLKSLRPSIHFELCLQISPLMPNALLAAIAQFSHLQILHTVVGLQNELPAPSLERCCPA